MKKVAFLFPGQGTQYVGMAKDLYEYPEVQMLYDLASKIAGFDLAEVSFNGPKAELDRTDRNQLVIVTHSLAVITVLCQELGIDNGMIKDKLKVSATAGLSLGEYTALYFADVISFDDLIYLIRNRGQYMQEACEENPGGMAVVFGLKAGVLCEVCEEAQQEIGGVAVVANHLLEDWHTISGSHETLELIFKLAMKKGAKRVVKLSEVAGAYHSPLMGSASVKMTDLLDKTTFRKPKVPFIPNVAGDYAGDPYWIREFLKQQMLSPVHWWQSMMKLTDIDEFWELGPDKVLTGLVKKIFPEKKAIAIGSIKDIQQLAASM